MKKILLFVLAGFFIVGCATPKGATREEQTNYVMEMRDKTLSELYKLKPGTETMIETAAGYGVFSNVSSYLLYINAGNGYGVVIDNETGKRTYMKMAQAGIGLGLGVKDFRVIFIFTTH